MMTDLADLIAKTLRNVDCRCAQHGGDNSYEAQAKAVIKKLQQLELGSYNSVSELVRNA
jgi:hypothetical protein